MKRLSFFIIVSACLLLLAGCGDTHRTSHTTASSEVINPAQCDPPVGQGRLGICTTQPAASKLRVPTINPPTIASRKLFPDASEFQGTVNWGAAHSHGLYAAIVKAYEVNFRQDSQFSHSWHQLAALHVWHAAYLFVRGGSCSSIADAYVGIVKANGGWDFWAGPPVLDMEVPSAIGMVPCLAARIKQDTGISSIIVYTAPGTWPGGGNNNAPLWIATYGSHFGCIWTCHPVAWQYTDGVFGPDPHSVYGLSRGDVSVDFGITGMFVHTHHPPDPICFTHRVPRAKCVAIKNQIVKDTRAVNASRTVYNKRGCPVLAHRERYFTDKIKNDHTAFGRQLSAHRRSALAATRRAYKTRYCSVFGGRVTYFTNKIKQAEAKS